MRQDERMDNLEAKLEGAPPQDKKQQQQPSEQEDKLKPRRISVACLHSAAIRKHLHDMYKKGELNDKIARLHRASAI
ncbi:hypothetical protein PR003_g26748 [Phytophthora rubi]|nr:hypothetical protein PR002_g26019 [Phytophthora rubi]KAE9284849.1 hypothetical protein PR003_g26748 [Phytophthora rubi]